MVSRLKQKCLSFFVQGLFCVYQKSVRVGGESFPFGNVFDHANRPERYFFHYLRTRQIMESFFFNRAPRFGAQILENHDRQKRPRRLARSQKLSNAKLSPPTRNTFFVNEKNMARKNDRQFWVFCGYFLRKISRNIKKSPRERKSSGCPTGPSLGCPNRTINKVWVSSRHYSSWKHLQNSIIIYFIQRYLQPGAETVQ